MTHGLHDCNLSFYSRLHDKLLVNAVLTGQLHHIGGGIRKGDNDTASPLLLDTVYSQIDTTAVR